jgi:hypothetical protein
MLVHEHHEGSNEGVKEDGKGDGWICWSARVLYIFIPVSPWM